MPTPDSLVASFGLPAQLHRITRAGYDDANAFSLPRSTEETIAINVIPSQPKQRQLPVHLQGQAMLRFTIPSSVDVSANRPGRPDRFTYNGRLWEVLEVNDDRHALMGVRKKTVLLAPVSEPVRAT